ncbi:hypothetical protein [Chondromyces apiculatus]|uniref:Extradiol ring-cleavage dioxygenase LigAB LigA subunit domain-containing protein n=1 Tax=Chondromyces apiculatus DSM 436 TaxID=1192034 RepID=A0A017TJ82_9BACT|nr:hypothetical protein [Chondromyces apiculatus]EYF08900.1 Hypothetical protein CAP_2761 [Chondromyces apiculatus DSM 436]
MATHPKLVDFFLSLGDNDRLKKFQADPDAAMDEAGLSDEEKSLVLSGDEDRIRKLIGDTPRTAGLRFVMSAMPKKR